MFSQFMMLCFQIFLLPQHKVVHPIAVVCMDSFFNVSSLFIKCIKGYELELHQYQSGKEACLQGSNNTTLNWARNVTMATQLAPKEAPAGLELGTFAGGCFWGLELKFQREPGVVKTSVGYAQGHKQNPSYEDVCRGTTGHTEAVQVRTSATR
jgi:hypothetical protein